MVVSSCTHDCRKKFGKDRKGNQRYRCQLCGKTWTEAQPEGIAHTRVPVETAKLVLRLLVEGNSIRSTERITGVHRDTVCKLIVWFGERCRRFMDVRMQVSVAKTTAFLAVVA